MSRQDGEYLGCGPDVSLTRGRIWMQWGVARQMWITRVQVGMATGVRKQGTQGMQKQRRLHPDAMPTRLTQDLFLLMYFGYHVTKIATIRKTSCWWKVICHRGGFFFGRVVFFALFFFLKFACGLGAWNSHVFFLINKYSCLY